jgi:zinc D-Ala-D-Ala carboxypeptidase
MPASRPSLRELLARIDVSVADIAGREPFPEATVLVSIGDDCQGRRARLAPDAAEAWNAMRAAARMEGVDLLVVSAFRSYEKQARLWEAKLRGGRTPAEIRRVLAVPGFSEHHTGRAIDIGTPGCLDLTEAFEATAAFPWLTARAAAFDFTLTYGRENALGVMYEPWHWCFG